jgi:hypothetical protein
MQPGVWEGRLTNGRITMANRNTGIGVTGHTRFFIENVIHIREVAG